MASERILVVDDEPYVRTVIAAMLEKSNYSPVLVSNGIEAIEHLEKDPPYDLVLSDIMMNGLDGMGLLERMRQIQPDTPMVLVTAIHDIGVAISAMRKGAYDYLLKPFEKEQLLATVRRALDYRRLVQQNAMYRQNLEQLVSARTEMLRQAMSDLERSYDITLEALGDALDLKDAETEGHSKRVTAYTIALARAHGRGPSADADRRPRRVSARYRQDGDSGCHSAEAGQARCGRAVGDARALRPRLSDAAQNSLSAGSCGDRLQPPGTL